MLRADLHVGVSVVLYADYTLVLAQERSHQAAAELATRGVAIVMDRIRQLGLEVALHRRRPSPFVAIGMRHVQSRNGRRGSHRRRFDVEVFGTRSRQPVELRGELPSVGSKTGTDWGCLLLNLGGFDAACGSRASRRLAAS